MRTKKPTTTWNYSALWKEADARNGPEQRTLQHGTPTGRKLSPKPLPFPFLGSSNWDDEDLEWIDLSKYNFNGCSLVNCNMRRSLLCYARFNGADLTGADLTGADLTGADLTGANLTGVKYNAVTCFYGVIVSDDTTMDKALHDRLFPELTIDFAEIFGMPAGQAAIG
jgi:uncharacterized protein YjbI with pentapeptide repeats